MLGLFCLVGNPFCCSWLQKKLNKDEQSDSHVAVPGAYWHACCSCPSTSYGLQLPQHVMAAAAARHAPERVHCGLRSGQSRPAAPPLLRRLIAY